MTSGRATWFFRDTVTQRKRRIVVGQTDRRGNDVYAVTIVQLSGVTTEPRLLGGSENTAGQEHVGRGLDLFCSDPEADIQPTDQFVIDGVKFEVDGPVNRYRGSRLGIDYCHCNLERITG